MLLVREGETQNAMYATCLKQTGTAAVLQRAENSYAKGIGGMHCTTYYHAKDWLVGYTPYTR